ncbi:MAG: hypothetical protein MRY74_03755 [Neomegalonema sp.]|nr:hypothetical protein [Neomegalonema sp.]
MNSIKKIMSASLVAAAAFMGVVASGVDAKAGEYGATYGGAYATPVYDHGYKYKRPVIKEIVRGNKVYLCKFWSKTRYTCEFSHYATVYPKTLVTPGYAAKKKTYVAPKSYGY